MSAPRYVPVLHWEPLPYLVIVFLLVLTGAIRPEHGGWYVLLLFAIALTAGWGVIAFMRERRTRNPDPMGGLTGLDGLAIVDAPALAASVRAVVPVADTHRHQSAIEIARVHGGPDLHAVLVPRARRWLSPRYRVGVQLIAAGTGDARPRHAGFLREDADARWRDRLDALRVDGRYVRVPARITGAAQPRGVELDVSGLESVVGPEPGNRPQ
ncbi:hypothetical protein [Agromyces marinus]|uniref:hypothetical protein n=1 Tax=Agromyces marinus TaxID=1389020 RepID=UPI001F36708E|nr:hypothetical protein [Agromyces marinus]